MFVPDGDGDRPDWPDCCDPPHAWHVAACTFRTVMVGAMRRVCWTRTICVGSGTPVMLILASTAAQKQVHGSGKVLINA
jgi:hypothetical protein